MKSDLENGLCDYHEELRRHARARARDPAEADDAVQECMTRALAYARDDRIIHNVRAYLFAILNNVLVDAGARASRSAKMVYLESEPDAGVQRPDQLAMVEWRELIRAIDSLPEDQRRAIVLVAVSGESYHGAAAMMNVPVGTIMSRLHRGRQTLRRIFSDSQPPHTPTGAVDSGA